MLFLYLRPISSAYLLQLEDTIAKETIGISALRWSGYVERKDGFLEFSSCIYIIQMERKVTKGGNKKVGTRLLMN